MVSALWKACSVGDLENVLELLTEASIVDIEIKDHTGATPLIEAVKNGNVEIVKALLNKGADPNNTSSQGRPEQYTSDPAMLELLNFAQSKLSSNGMPAHGSGYAHDANADATKAYYPSPGPYAYYPSAPPEGAVYYPLPPPSGEQLVQNGPPNLPPPDVARYIPCRYYPACRYGASCMFLHPQGSYFQGPLPPPAQYPVPYDSSMNQQLYSPNYYAVPPPSFPHSNGIPSHLSSMSPSGPHVLPAAQMIHARTGSERMVSPGQGHFSPPPAPYGTISPISPSYPHQGQVPIPLSIPPLPPLHQQPPLGSESPHHMYSNQTPNAAAPFTVQRESTGQYPPQSLNGHSAHPAINGRPKSPATQPEADGYAPNPMYRDGVGHTRRGSIRRTQFGGRKPACLFFPSGRCRNGDDCRFPHIMPENTATHHPPHFLGRPGPRLPRVPQNDKGMGTLEEKFAGMALRDGAPSRQNGGESSSRLQSTDTVGRHRPPQGFRGTQHPTNVPRTDKKPSIKQRVPNADEFPVLMGATTPPTRSPGNAVTVVNGQSGPTAAQVLQAPAPLRRDSMKESSTKESSTRVGTPDSTKDSKPITERNGIVPEVHQELAVANKLPVSFALVATSAPDIAKEVSVSA